MILAIWPPIWDFSPEAKMVKILKNLELFKILAYVASKLKWLKSLKTLGAFKILAIFASLR